MSEAERTDAELTDAFVVEVVRRTAASLTAEEASAILYLTPRAPERKPKNVGQGVCLSRMGRHELAPGVYAVLAEETRPMDRWSPFRLTPLGLAVRSELEALAHVE